VQFGKERARVIFGRRGRHPWRGSPRFFPLNLSTGSSRRKERVPDDRLDYYVMERGCAPPMIIAL